MRDRGFVVIFGHRRGHLCLLRLHPADLRDLAGRGPASDHRLLFVLSAQNGLSSTIGQQHVMSGQVSTVWNIFLSVPILGGYFIGGMLSGQLEARTLIGPAASCFCRRGDHGRSRRLWPVEAGQRV